MPKTLTNAIAIAIPADHYDSPFKALAESSFNLGQLVFDFMYGTPQRCNVTFIFAIGLTLFGLGLDHAHSVAALQGCPVTSF